MVFGSNAAFGSGRIVATDQSTTPHYYLCDHLGSTRAIVAETGVIETYDYYPYGLTWQQAEQPIGSNTYLFTGKEWQAQDGIDLYDFGARFYQPRFGRWLSFDPLAEEYMGFSPYAYCGNDPVNRVDIDGEKWVTASGKLKYQDGSWTKYATQTDKRIGTELQKTPTGKRMFDHLVNGDVATEVIFAKLPDGAYGKNKLRKQPSQEMWQATITLDLDNITQKAQRYGITTEQATSSTFGHEIRHTEDKNIQMQLRTKDSYKEIPYADREEEKDADAVSFQIINEYKNKMNENETNLLHILFMYLGRLFR